MRGAIEQSTLKSDEELSTYRQHQMVVPKLCLTMAVMEHLEITQLTYQPACGSCAGLLVHDSFWGPTAESGDAYWPLSGIPDGTEPDACSRRAQTLESRV